MTKKTVKHYYAEFCPYGIRSLSDGDRLMQFESKKERDDMVKLINSNDYFDRAESVTLRSVSHRYRISDFNDLDVCHEGFPRTCRDKIYFEIAPK